MVVHSPTLSTFKRHLSVRSSCLLSFIELVYSRKIISLLFLTNLVYVLLLFPVFNDFCHTISVLPTFSVF